MRTARRLILLALSAGLAAGACHRAESPTVHAGKSRMSEQVDDLSLADERVDLGRTVAGGHVRGQIRIRAGDRGAVVTQVSPSCGCTITDVALPVTLKPGEIFAAPVALDLARLTDLGASADGAPRLIEKTVSIASQRGARLTAHVSVEVLGDLTIQPAQVLLATTPPGRQASSSIVVAAAADAPPPEVLGLDLPRQDLAAKVETAPDGSQRAWITWSPAHAEDLDVDATLRLKGVPGGIPVRIVGRSAAPISVDPAAIEVLDAPRGRPVTRRITLHRRDELPLEITGATCTAHRVQVEVAPGQGPIRTVEVMAPVPLPPAELQGTVIIRTDLETQPLIEVPVRVRSLE